MEHHADHQTRIPNLNNTVMVVFVAECRVWPLLAARTGSDTGSNSRFGRENHDAWLAGLMRFWICGQWQFASGDMAPYGIGSTLRIRYWFCLFMIMSLTDHLLLDSASNIRPLIPRWEINKFKNCWYKSVRIVEVLKLLFRQFLNFSSSQRDMSGPIWGDLSNNRWLGGIVCS